MKLFALISACYLPVVTQTPHLRYPPHTAYSLTLGMGVVVKQG